MARTPQRILRATQAIRNHVPLYAKQIPGRGVPARRIQFPSDRCFSPTTVTPVASRIAARKTDLNETFKCSARTCGHKELNTKEQGSSYNIEERTADHTYFTLYLRNESISLVPNFINIIRRTLRSIGIGAVTRTCVLTVCFELSLRTLTWTKGLRNFPLQVDNRERVISLFEQREIYAVFHLSVAKIK